MSMYRYIKGIADAKKIETAKQTRENLKVLGLDYPCELDDICESSIHIPTKEINDGYDDIIEINVKDIPKEVTKIQFIISY